MDDPNLPGKDDNSLLKNKNPPNQNNCRGTEVVLRSPLHGISGRRCLSLCFGGGIDVSHQSGSNFVWGKQQGRHSEGRTGEQGLRGSFPELLMETAVTLL